MRPRRDWIRAKRLFRAPGIDTPRAEVILSGPDTLPPLYPGTIILYRTGRCISLSDDELLIPDEDVLAVCDPF